MPALDNAVSVGLENAERRTDAGGIARGVAVVAQSVRIKLAVELRELAVALGANEFAIDLGARERRHRRRMPRIAR